MKEFIKLYLDGCPAAELSEIVEYAGGLLPSRRGDEDKVNRDKYFIKLTDSVANPIKDMLFDWVKVMGLSSMDRLPKQIASSPVVCSSSFRESFNKTVSKILSLDSSLELQDVFKCMVSVMYMNCDLYLDIEIMCEFTKSLFKTHMSSEVVL